MALEKGLEFFYLLALEEGEGLGTAYEYLVKNYLITRLLKYFEKPKSVLIAGLPEKYGLGLDFIFLAKSLACEIAVVDDRDDVIELFKTKVKYFTEINLLTTADIRIYKIKNLNDFIETKKYFSLVLSSAVLQRIPAYLRSEYIRQLSEKANYGIFFVPNKGNDAHKTVTELEALSLKDLFGYLDNRMSVLEAGHIDLPPFYPGAKLSSYTRDQIKKKSWGKVLIGFMEQWSHLEFFLPSFVKDKFAHMIYLILEFKK
jgi:hypothetical protein